MLICYQHKKGIWLLLCLYDDYMFDVLLVMSSLDVFPMFMKKEDLLFFDNDRCNLKGKFIELKIFQLFPQRLKFQPKMFNWYLDNIFDFSRVSKVALNILFQLWFMDCNTLFVSLYMSGLYRYEIKKQSIAKLQFILTNLSNWFLI